MIITFYEKLSFHMGQKIDMFFRLMRGIVKEEKNVFQQQRLNKGFSSFFVFSVLIFVDF